MAPNEYEYPNMKNPKIIRAREEKNMLPSTIPLWRPSRMILLEHTEW